MNTHRAVGACPPRGDKRIGSPVPPSAADEELAILAKALGHPARVRIVRLLANTSTCHCGDVVDELPLAQPTVSQHLKVLKEAGLVRAEPDGHCTCYRLDRRVVERLRHLLDECC